MQNDRRDNMKEYISPKMEISCIIETDVITSSSDSYEIGLEDEIEAW